MSPIRLEPCRALADQFELLKARVTTALNGRAAGPVTLAFTSCESGEGVTNVATNYAAALAEDDEHQVLLIDGNLKKPKLQQYFETKDVDASAIPNDNKDLSLPAWRVFRANPNMDVLLARRSIDCPARVFSTSVFEEFLARAKDRYDYIVIDCPPVRGASASAILPAKADATVLVVEADRVRREVLQRTVMTLEDTGANLVGVVLNKRKYPIPSFIYKLL